MKKVSKAERLSKAKHISKAVAEKRWKDKIKELAGYKCELCGRGEFQLHAHHIERKQSNYMRLLIDNGACLCAYHHMSIHGINGLEALDTTRALLESHFGKEHLDRLKQLKNKPPKVDLEYMLEHQGI